MTATDIRRAVADHELRILGLLQALELARARIEWWATFAPRYEREGQLAAHLEAIDALIGQVRP